MPTIGITVRDKRALKCSLISVKQIKRNTHNGEDKHRCDPIVHFRPSRPVILKGELL